MASILLGIRMYLGIEIYLLKKSISICVFGQGVNSWHKDHLVPIAYIYIYIYIGWLVSHRPTGARYEHEQQTASVPCGVLYLHTRFVLAIQPKRILPGVVQQAQ